MPDTGALARFAGFEEGVGLIRARRDMSLLVEVEERQGIAQLFDVPPLPYEEVKIATADGGGQVNALAIDIEAAFLEYLDMFYNLRRAGTALRALQARKS